MVLFFRSQEISVPGMRMGLSGSDSASRRSGSRSKKKWHFEVHAEETLDDSRFALHQMLGFALGNSWIPLTVHKIQNLPETFGY